MDDVSQAVPTPVPASSVLLVRDTPFEVLLVRRSTRAVFSSALVFPGGIVDTHDASEEWLPHVTGAELLETSERSFRIAACRELFEEADVLFCDGAGSLTGSERRSYFERIRSAGARVPLGSVIPFGHWITPEGVGKRFDTRFYVCRAPDGALAKSDGREIVTVEWVRPQEIVASAHRGERALMFPTLMNLMRLAESADVESALAAAANRPNFTVRPRVEQRGESKFIVIPAMAGYGVTEQEFRD
jgi:8-oxo-dGTP pyrophosphatase MutT (NUDIX family)